MPYNKFSEVPYQNFAIIKRTVQSKIRNGKHSSDSDLFVDPSFPPDLTSLTYVYTGDDRYEKMVFKRPLSFESDATFCGIGGVWNAPFPWKSFKKRDWFQAAVVVVSLGVKYMEKIIPGYRHCEQNFINEYIGAFRFNIWRFGEWHETIVDDNLPCLQTNLLHCKAYGNPPEFWGPLLEKAYAKIEKAYESIESGNTLNALADLTGDVCEFYTQDINPPANLFYIMYKSYLNRSLMVCWRNEKRLTYTGFHHTLESIENSSCEDDEEDKLRYLHIVNAIAKFPTTDGRLIGMVRLKCSYNTEPSWHGKFSNSDHLSWGSVSLWFLEKFKPLTCKYNDEYWMTYEDFRCNFGGLIIISGTDAFRSEGLSIERYYKHGDIFDNESRPTSNHSNEWLVPHASLSNKAYSSYVVRSTSSCTKKTNVRQKGHSPSASSSTQDSFVSMILNSRNSSSMTTNNNEYVECQTNRKKWTWRRGSSGETDHPFSRIESITSVRSQDGESMNSESDVTINSNGLACRRKSAPIIGRKFSSPSSYPHLTHSSFLATKTDNFRARGEWKLLVEHRDRWTRPDSQDMANYPRVHFSISKHDIVNEMIPQNCRGKSHILISLLQDYRRGPSVNNSQLVAIGFCLYKCKQSESKDLSKYRFVGQNESNDEQREITARYDLEDGNFVLVPYSKTCQHEGEFFVRILGEKDIFSGTRNGCIVS